MINIPKSLDAIRKLKRIEPTTELEAAVIKNIINSHLINIHTIYKNESINIIRNYTTIDYTKCLEELENKCLEL